MKSKLILFFILTLTYNQVFAWKYKVHSFLKYEVRVRLNATGKKKEQWISPGQTYDFGSFGPGICITTVEVATASDKKKKGYNWRRVKWEEEKISLPASVIPIVGVAESITTLGFLCRNGTIVLDQPHPDQEVTFYVSEYDND